MHNLIMNSYITCYIALNVIRLADE